MKSIRTCLALSAVILLTPLAAFTSEPKSESVSSSSYKDYEKKADHSKKKESDKSKEGDKKEVKKAKQTSKHVSTAHAATAILPEDVMKQLLEGNKRHVSFKYANPHRDQATRKATAKGQHPKAIILGCADSRIPPEMVFDQGVGDLFVVRTAGHVVDPVALGSMEYAAEHLGTKLIVVLGHERCGAVDATLKGGEAPGNLKPLVESIKPAIEKAKAKPSHSHDCDLLCGSVKMNVKQQIENIKKGSPVLSEMIQDGVLKIVGAYYDLDSGEVTLTYIPSLI